MYVVWWAASRSAGPLTQWSATQQGGGRYTPDMNTTEVSVVTAWHGALNDGDVERLVALSSDDVEIVGPRGSARGAQVLREWVGRANIRMAVQRVFARDGTVVAEERAEWRSAENGEVVGSDTVATILRVSDGRVIYIDRRPNLSEALEAARLGESDEHSLT